jgi:hypothetical protein
MLTSLKQTLIIKDLIIYKNAASSQKGGVERKQATSCFFLISKLDDAEEV